MRAWLTPETLPDLACGRVYLPDSDDLRAAFRGAFLLLCEADNWEQFGTQTPEDTADLFYRAWETSLDFTACETSQGGVMLPIGSMFWFPSYTAPTHCMVCDGSLLDPSVYPDLFTVLGYTFGQSGDLFALPHMHAGDAAVMADVSAQEYELGMDGGNLSIWLDAAQMPEHSHNLFNQAASGVTARVLPSANTQGTVTATSSAGAGEAIDIRNPFLALVLMMVVENAA